LHSPVHPCTLHAPPPSPYVIEIQLRCAESSPRTLIAAYLLEDFARILWNASVHCHVYRNPPPNSILGQIHPVHTHPTSNPF
jgi:hypothetical protein